jgi:septal ring-binding cell division protein DamX
VWSALALDVAKRRIEARQVVGVALVLIGGAFALGGAYGARAARAASPAAANDPLAKLDEPLMAAPREDEALRAHEVLTAAHPEVLPVAAPPPTATTIPTSTSTSTSTSTGTGTPSPTSTVALTAPATRTAAPTPTATRTATPTATRTARPNRERAAVAARGAFTIQVASVPARAEAEKVAHRYARRAPRIVPADVPGKGRMWRVQIGSYASRDAAAHALGALGGAGFVTALR